MNIVWNVWNAWEPNEVTPSDHGGWAWTVVHQAMAGPAASTITPGHPPNRAMTKLRKRLPYRRYGGEISGDEKDLSCSRTTVDQRPRAGVP